MHIKYICRKSQVNLQVVKLWCIDILLHHVGESDKFTRDSVWALLYTIGYSDKAKVWQAGNRKKGSSGAGMKVTLSICDCKEKKKEFLNILEWNGNEESSFPIWERKGKSSCSQIQDRESEALP